MSDIKGKIEKTVKESVDLSFDQAIANETAEQIKKRTRLGFGFDENGNQVRLKPLSDSYRSQRKGDIAFFTAASGQVIPYKPYEKPYLPSTTTPAKSNATKTGQMLESIKGKADGSRMLLSLEGLRSDGYSNEEVKDFVELQGRRFWGLTNAEKNELARKLKNKVLSNLN